MKQLLQLVAMGAARLATIFLDEIEPALVYWPVSGGGVIDHHGSAPPLGPRSARSIRFPDDYEPLAPPQYIIYLHAQVATEKTRLG
jgi:hypothetical protein